MRERKRIFQGLGGNKEPAGDKPGSGPGGKCICPKCGYTRIHTRLSPCNNIKCPRCGTTMTKQ